MTQIEHDAATALEAAQRFVRQRPVLPLWHLWALHMRVMRLEDALGHLRIAPTVNLSAHFGRQVRQRTRTVRNTIARLEG